MNGENLPYQNLDVIPFTAIESEWGDGVGDNMLALAAGVGMDNGSITPTQLSLGDDSAFVSNSNSTSSTSFVDIATVGPTVTVNIGPNGKALVCIYASVVNGGSGGVGRMGFALSGSNTQSPAEDLSLSSQGTNAIYCTGVFHLKGLSPGSTTFQAKYRAGTTSATFANRRIAVIPL